MITRQNIAPWLADFNMSISEVGYIWLIWKEMSLTTHMLAHHMLKYPLNHALEHQLFEFLSTFEIQSFCKILFHRFGRLYLPVELNVNGELLDWLIGSGFHSASALYRLCSIGHVMYVGYKPIIRDFPQTKDWRLRVIWTSQTISCKGIDDGCQCKIQALSFRKAQSLGCSHLSSYRTLLLHDMMLLGEVC